MNNSTNKAGILSHNNVEDSLEKRCVPIRTKKVPNSELEKFKKLIEKKYGRSFDSYWDLHKWSVKSFPDFWKEIWHYFNVKSSKPYNEVFVKTGDGFLDNEWFTGAAFNLAENILRVTDKTIGIICEDEFGNRESITFEEIYDQVKLYASAFRKVGLGIGDRVGYYISSRKEAVFSMLAAASIGALWGGPIPYHGAKTASKIMKTIDPKIIISVDHFQYSGKEYCPIDNLSAVAKDIPSLQKVIIVVTRKETLSRDISDIPKSVFLEEFLQTGLEADGRAPDIVFEQLPFSHPTIINFTSGTTADPKGVVHSAGAFIAQLRDFALHQNLKRGDVVYTYSPVGWTVWDYLLPNLALGVTLLLFNGSPEYIRDGYTIWDVISDNKVSFVFLAPAFVDAFATDNILPKRGANLDSLKILLLAGSPVKPQDYKVLYDKVKKDLIVHSVYGATESLGAFSGSDVNSDLYTCECQVPALGVDLHCFDEDGNSVIGQRGELVVTTPCPIFPIYLWNDENNSKMNEEYFSKYEGVWCQNDEAWINPKTKGLLVIGRSDNTLNQNGERLSSNDIYCAIGDIEELQDYICVGQDKWDGESRIVLFVKPKEGYSFNPELKEKIEKRIQEELSPEVPEVILGIPEVPYNLNNKKMESTVKNILKSNVIPEVKSIRNPECLKYYCNIPEILQYNMIGTE